MKKRVLVFPCGSEIGLEVYRSLYVSTHFEIFGGSSTDDHGMFVYSNYIGDLPHVTDPDFVAKLNETIAANKIDIIIPAHDSVVLKLAQVAAADEIHAKIMTSLLKTCEITRSKLQTYQLFEAIIPIPRLFKMTEAIPFANYPVFLKPDVGQGSKGTYKATSAAEVAFYYERDSSLLALEYLPGKEYTVDCFTDRHGKLRFFEGRQRNRIASGISVNSSKTDHPLFKTLAEKINATLELRGAWFFQVKERANGELVLMEIAPRIAGTMGLIRCKGINMVLLSLFDLLGYDISVFENNDDVVIDRALENRYKHSIEYRHVYLDFDDLVLFNNHVNPLVMAFVYQCINKGIKIHLLTKHKDDLAQTLANYRLSDVFDELIWIKDEDSKSSYITERAAIFIDDSFTERQQVHAQCQIPVFDGHMIESLMEQF